MPGYIEALKQLVRIPSISFDNFDQKFVLDSAEAVKKMFTEAGFTNVQFLLPPSGRPSVYAESLTKPENPTVLLYAHHDVQPPMRETLWKSAPFEPEVRGDRLYGRGTADDKAGIITHIAAARLVREILGDKGPNLKFIIEGEEESGSAGFAEILAKNAKLLKCDAVIIASGPMPDPGQALCRMISALTDKDGNIAIPHFEDGIVPPTPEELESYGSLGYSEETFRKEGGVLDCVKLNVPGDKILETLWRRPSIVVTAMEVGSRTNAGNVLQDSAYARIGIRLAPGMDAGACTQMLVEFLHQHVPSGMECSITAEDGANPFTTDIAHPFFKKMGDAMAEAYGQPTKFIGCGASIPGAELFRSTLGDIPILMTGLEDPECAAHGENESLYLPDFEAGITAETLFFASLAK